MRKIWFAGSVTERFILVQMILSAYAPNGVIVSHLNTKDLFLRTSVSQFSTKYSYSDTINLKTFQIYAKSAV